MALAPSNVADERRTPAIGAVASTGTFSGDGLPRRPNAARLSRSGTAEQDAPRRPRLLIVGFVTSVHLVRYLDLLKGAEWDLHLFDALPGSKPNPGYDTPMTLHLERESAVTLSPRVTVVPDPQRGTGIEGRSAHLARVIEQLRPDVIHSHELAITGTVVHRTRQRLDGFDAPWLVTNWGSDIFWNGRSPNVVPHLREVLAACDYYSAECHRDVALARAFGFRGEVLGVWAVAGGIDPRQVAELRTPGPTSARRAIALKGVVGEHGRADVGLAAIERCAPLLQGWELCGYQMEPPVIERTRELAAATGMRYTHMSDGDTLGSSHAQILAMHGRSRVSLGLNRTDGLSMSFVEALTMGSMPVQGHGSCGYELTPDGVGALFVDPRDVDAVTAALQRAITDDALVDRAAARNASIAAEHLDRGRIATRVLDGYERIISEKAMEAL